MEDSQNTMNRHQENDDTILVITATNNFVAAPIIKAHGIENQLATQPEIVPGRFTGKYLGTSCFQVGKIDNLLAWLGKNGECLDGSTFYSDSHNDLPMLKLVEHSVAVSADPVLKKYAQGNNWQILDQIQKYC